MPVRAVFFDFGGVIMRTEYQSPRQHLAERAGTHLDPVLVIAFRYPLNTALTVPKGRPQAHAGIGWAALVAEVLAGLDSTPRAFLLWGAPAQKRARACLHNTGHLRVESAHPSPLSAYRGYFGSRPFSRVNDWLVAQDAPPIDWG